MARPIMSKLSVIVLLFTALAGRAANAADVQNIQNMRIISLYPGHTENIAALGAAKSLVAISRIDDLESLQKLPRLPLNITPESVLAYGVDTVILRSLNVSANPNLIPVLEQAGVKVHLLEPPSWNEFDGYLKHLAGIVGADPRLALDRLEKVRKKVKENVQARSKNSSPRVFLEATGREIHTFLTGLGCECVPLFETPDGRFPNHHPDPQKRENLSSLIAKVREVGADAGFGFDGDADRLGVVDERGEVIFGDRLMALYWAEILEKYPGADVIVEPKCSMALPEEIERLGGKVVWWKSGHSVIKAKMKEINALFAGELSGHMFFADEYYGFDDSFYAAARLLRILSGTGGKLSELMAHIPLYPATEEARIPCPDSEKFAVTERIRDRALEEYEGLTLDGVRIIYPGGWGLIRASNTQPVITARCEGKDEKKLRFIMEDVRNRIVSEGLPEFEWTF